MSLTKADFPPVDLAKFVPAVLEVYAKWEDELYGLPWLGHARDVVECRNDGRNRSTAVAAKDASGVDGAPSMA